MEPPIGYGLTYRSIFLESRFRKAPGRIPASTSFPMSAFIKHMPSFRRCGSRFPLGNVQHLGRRRPSRASTPARPIA
jgi:hypothetical protein